MSTQSSLAYERIIWRLLLLLRRCCYSAVDLLLLFMFRFRYVRNVVVVVAVAFTLKHFYISTCVFRSGPTCQNETLKNCLFLPRPRHKQTLGFGGAVPSTS